ncbi:phage tail tape measure protein [Neobacillus niacini]|uniref:phage tail tape measure protein n=1 Tax=Neobacillus niacini TaxID=86668 RepID=UPI002FFDD402
MADQSILVQVGADISNLTNGLNTASNQVSSFVSNTQKGFQALGDLGKIITGFGLAVAAGLGGAVNVAADFDTAIRKAGAIAGASVKELDGMKNAALDLGAKTSQSASGVAVAMTELAAKGFSANQVIAAMPGIISAAEASGEDLALTADTIASALNIWSLEAAESSRVADVLAMSANVSAAGIDDLGYVMKYAGAPAAALGISLEEVAAAAGIMTNAGLDGSSAGTSLRASLLALNNPAKAQQKIMDSLGFSLTDSGGKAKSLSQIVGDLSKSLEGQTEAQKVATLAKLVGTEAVSGFLSLTKAGPAEIDKMSEALRNSGGASAEAAAKMKAGIGGALENLSGAFETLSIKIGDKLIPYVLVVAKWLSGLADTFSNLSDSTMKFLVVGAALSAIFALIIGPMLIMIGFIPAIVEGFGAIALMFGTTSTALLGVIGTVLGVVAALVAIGIGLVIAYKKVEWFRDMVDSAWAWIKNAWNLALDFIMEIVKSVMSAVASFIGDRLSDITKWWSENGQAIMELAKFAFAFLKSYIQTAMGVISMIFQTIFPVIVGVVKIAWAIIQAVFSTAINFVLGLIGFFAKIFTGDVKGAMETVKNTFSTIWENIKKIFGDIDLASIGKNIVEGLVNGIKSMASAVGKAVSGIASAIPAKIKSFLGIHSPSRVLLELGEFTGEGFANGIESMVRKVQGVTADMANAALPETSTLSLAYETPSMGALAVKSAGSFEISQQSSENSRPIYITNVYELDGYEVARVTEQHLDTMQSDKFTIRSRMGGMKR